MNGSPQSYRDFVRTLSADDTALAFGQHGNADVVRLTDENRSLCATLARLRDRPDGLSLTHDGDEEGAILRQRLSRILQSVPATIDYGPGVDEDATTRRDAVDIVLLREVRCIQVLQVVQSRDLSG